MSRRVLAAFCTRLVVALLIINPITGSCRRAHLRRRWDGTGLDVLVVLGRDDDPARAHRPCAHPVAARDLSADDVRAGDYDVSVPVTPRRIGDLRHLPDGGGLAERDGSRRRWLPRREVASTSSRRQGGVEVEVTVLFCDVRDFTAFASGATPQEVVTALNRLFEVIVPIIAKHGGHVDKFEGDGLLAVFGAPEPFPDHADRAVSAACEIGVAINERGQAGDLRLGVGVSA
jgi:hypothetical protein